MRFMSALTTKEISREHLESEEACYKGSREENSGAGNASETISENASENTSENASQEGGAFSPFRVFSGAIAIPVAFLGLGVYRAWIEIVFVGSFVSFPDLNFSMRDLFDVACCLTAVLCIVFARRISPFFNKPVVYGVCGSTLTISTIGMFGILLFPQVFEVAAPLWAILGGFGIALLILFWSELYGCLNPLRVALYYSASIVVGALIVYIYQGFKEPWLAVMTILLPAASLYMVSRSFASLPPAERPATTWTSFSVPWKAVLFMAAYAFGYGLMEGDIYSDVFGPHSAPGVVLVGLLVFIGVAFRGGRFDFALIYRIALPLTVLALFLVQAIGDVQGEAAAFCMSAAYTAQSILIMLIIANICYRYRVSAVWLFGIERSIRLVVMGLGRFVANITYELGVFGEYGATFVSLLAIIAVVIATTILLTERDLSSRWGANFISGGVDTAAILRKEELEERCNEIAITYHLTAREKEVLELLAQRKTVGIIERELLIANGTAKAHVRHIYQKLNIHTRQELFDLLNIDNRENVS